MIGTSNIYTSLLLPDFTRREASVLEAQMINIVPTEH